MQTAGRGFLVVLILAPLGLWGCGQETTTSSSKVRDLASRNAKLEEEQRTSATANESLRKRLSQMEAQRAELAKQVEQLKEAARDRDELRRQVSVRTSERDALHAHLLQFGKELQTLVGRVEAASSSRGLPSSVPTAMVRE
jgi:predicted RNase H-like nuclease (RuvC/YqgF family)